jgi:hypothetical protein
MQSLTFFDRKLFNEGGSFHAYALAEVEAGGGCEAPVPVPGDIPAKYE